MDEALGGHCTGIEVTLHADGSAEVRDNGRGIPVDVERKTKLSGVELVMTRLHAGGKFGGGSYTASGGLHGVGASVVNALASRLDVEVDREGAHLGGELPPRRHRRVRRAGADRELHQEVGAAPSSAASPGGPPGPGSGSGRTGRCSSGTPGSASTRSPSGPGRPPTWCPA